MYGPTKPYKEEIINLIKQTWETPYVSVKDGLIIKKAHYKNFLAKIFHIRSKYPECYHTDGIDTKGIYHWQKRSFKEAVQDALAMNLNDLAFVRAAPYVIIDHLFIPEDDHNAILEIINPLAKECKKRNIAIAAGETAIHNNMEGLEISITTLGFIKDPKQNKFRRSDYLIGLPSNGLHSNGFTKVRELFPKDFKEDFIKPTHIYLEDILELNKKIDIHGMMHITGGAYTKLKPLLEEDCKVFINEDHKLEPQPIFTEIYSKNISDKEMYKTFNCGIGFILGIAKQDVNECLAELENEKFKVDIIGRVYPGRKEIVIESKFSPKPVIL